MRRLSGEVTEYLQLFQAVLPAFIEALPPWPSAAPADRKQEILKNVTTILRFEVNEMQQVMIPACWDYDLPDVDISLVSDALEDVLFSLEDLVLMNTDVQLVSPTEFSRLQMLRDRILGSNTNSTVNLPSHCPDRISTFISYGRESAHYRRTIRVAQEFNRVMRSISDSLVAETESQMSQIFQQQYQPDAEPREQDTASAEIYKARVLCETTKTLFNLLIQKPKPCQTPHSAFIHLTGFSQLEIDMIMSLCVENESKKRSKKWHQVYCTSKIPSSACIAPRQSTESICSVLERSRKSKSVLHVHLQKDGSWKCPAASTADRMKAYVSPPELTLEELLDAKQAGPGRRLSKKDKLDLAVAIARSFLHLSSSPLLEGQWSTSNIYVAQFTDERASGLRTRPYIVRKLDNNSPADEPEDSSNINRFVLDLGVLLWQLLSGRKVTIEPEDEEEDEDDPSLPLFNALNREHGISQELVVEKPFLDIIANCLNLCSLYDLDEQAFREKMYWDVVMPLRNYLESFSRTTEAPPAVDRVKSPPLRSHMSSVKSDIDTYHLPRLGSRSQNSLSLLKGFTVENAFDITVRPRSIPSLRPMFADFNLLGSSVDIKDSSSWLDKFSLMNMRQKSLRSGNAPPIRIAVLDTGCNTNHEYFDGPGLGEDERLEGHWVDWVAGSTEMVDEDPQAHGTAMLTLLLRLLPDAEIFVARVAKNTEDLAIAQERIAKAIRFAASEPWDVEIVSLSFGFTESACCIEEAIAYAEQRKGQKIFFFAAANNQGRNQKEMFPAWSETVISVRGASHEGAFIPRYNPDPQPHNQDTKLYGTISENVPCDSVSGTLVKSGCSVATPIVAAIAAMVISIVSCEAARFADIKDARGLIRTRRGMLSVFNVMTQSQKEPTRYLAPWQLFKHDTVDFHTISFALSRLPPQSAGYSRQACVNEIHSGSLETLIPSSSGINSDSWRV